MKRITEEAVERQSKKTKATKRSLFDKKQSQKNFKRVRKTQQVVDESDDSNDDDSDDDFKQLPLEGSDLESFGSLEEEDFSFTPTAGQFYLVQYETAEDKCIKHYIGELLDFNEAADVYNFSSLRLRHGKFVYPNIPDLTTVKKNEIVKEVTGTRLGTTSRQNRARTFDVDVVKYNLF